MARLPLPAPFSIGYDCVDTVMLQPGTPRVHLLAEKGMEVSQEARAALLLKGIELHEIISTLTEITAQGVTSLLYELHRQEYPQAFDTSVDFRKAVSIESLSVWADGGWAVTLHPHAKLFAGSQVLYSHPAEAEPFARVVERIVY